MNKKNSSDRFYGISFSHYKVINYLKYKGKGRPKNTDYQTVEERQKQLDSLYNFIIDKYEQRNTNKME